MNVSVMGLFLLTALGTSFVAMRESDVRRARRTASFGAVFGLMAALLHGGLLPVAMGAIGLVCVALTPLPGATPGTFGRIGAIAALSLAATLSPEPLAALFIAASVAPVWAELAAREPARGALRVFAVHLIPGTLLLLAGAALFTNGLPHLAALLLAGGIAVRQGLLPFHAWLPALSEELPPGVTLAFSAPQLAMVSYIGLAPEYPEVARVFVVMGGLTALFGALLALAQSRPRRMLAYMLQSLAGLVALGLSNEAPLAHAGALLVWAGLGVAIAAFGMAIAALEARRAPLTLLAPGGNFARTPRLATALLLLALTLLGLPGTLGFVAQDMLVHGVSEGRPVLGVVAIAVLVLNAITLLRCFFMLCTGTTQHAGEQDLTRREAVVFACVVAAVLAVGLWPAAVTPWLVTPTALWATR